MAGQLVGIFSFVLLGVLYFVPTIVGLKKRDRNGIHLLNLFLGWTLIGWVGALIWAVLSPEKTRTFQYRCNNCNSDVKESDKFCPECGGNLTDEKICPKCDDLNKEEAKFCASCGFKLEEETKGRKKKTKKND